MLIEVTCSNIKCGIRFKKKSWEIRGENNFCTQYCANTYNNNRKGTGELNVHTYRTRALEFYGEACTICGYSIVIVLEVHHRDGDRSNNVIENLDVLCPNHHKEFETGVRTY